MKRLLIFLFFVISCGDSNHDSSPSACELLSDNLVFSSKSGTGSGSYVMEIRNESSCTVVAEEYTSNDPYQNIFEYSTFNDSNRISIPPGCSAFIKEPVMEPLRSLADYFFVNEDVTADCTPSSVLYNTNLHEVVITD